jgi:hypothetical protein
MRLIRLDLGVGAVSFWACWKGGLSKRMSMIAMMKEEEL